MKIKTDGAEFAEFISKMITWRIEQKIDEHLAPVAGKLEELRNLLVAVSTPLPGPEFGP